MRLDEITIEEIKSKANIVDVISRYINVIKKGNNYVAVCPFHSDTNPSMNISVDKQIYKCFSCGAGGNVFTFVSEYEKVGFIEAVKKVASYINNKISEYSKIESFRRQSVDQQHILLELNITDDYFKAKKQIDILQEEAKIKEKELYDLKHELIAAQIKLENTEKSLRSAQQELQENSRVIVRLETELRNQNR